MNKAKLGTILLLILSLSLPAFAVRVDIAGLVTDAGTGEPLPGANVVIKGALAGAATDAQGRFEFNYDVVGEITLIVRFMGYKTQEQSFSASDNLTNLQFPLELDVLKMDAVVVTGQGYQLRKKELATPVSTLDAAEIEAAPVETLDGLLQAKVAGTSIKFNSGQPGTGSRMQIRGVKSANVNQTPVIYIDGVRVDNNDNFRLARGTGGLESNALSDILIGDVERVEVIKGGAAASLYGSESANGVIQIFTKKGKAGAPKWKFGVEQGINQPETKFILEDFTKDHILESGHFQKYRASVDGGSTTLTYHLSGHIQGNEGITPKTDDLRWGLQAGFRAFPSEKLQIDFSGSLVRHVYGRIYNNNAIASIITSVEGHQSDFFPAAGSTLDEQLELRDTYLLPDIDEYVNRYTFATTARWEPVDWFSTRMTLGTDYRKSEFRTFDPIASEVVTSTPGGGLFRSDRDYITLTLDYTGTIKYPYEGPITSTFTFGAQGFREEDRESQIQATEFGLPGTDDLDNAANISAQESNQEIFSGGFFFNEQLGFMDKIFLNLGIRFDGNTAFGDEISLVSYPKVGLAYSVSDESFWFLKKWVPEFKIRGSWGQTGSFPAPFLRDRTYNQVSFLNAPAAQFGNPGDASLGPEKTTTLEVGFDMALLNQRVAVEFNYYNDVTTDALFQVPSQPSTGLGFQTRNVGEIENTGIEVGLDATILDSRNVRLSIGGSFATVNNKVTSLGGSAPFNIGGFSFLPLRVEEGHPVGIFRTNIPQDDGTFLANQLVSSPLAEQIFSARLNLTLFRNFRLNVTGDGQMGGFILNTGAVIRYFNGAEPEASMVPAGFNFVTASDVFITESDYFKIREISASYDVPGSYFGTEITLHASVRNVYIFSKSDRLDPELNGVRAAGATDVGGINFFTLSMPRQFRFSVLFNL